MRNKYRIVPCNDPQVIDSLHREIFPEDDNDDLPNTAWVVKDAQGALSGFCTVREARQLPDCAFLTRAGVSACARGNGLQRRMIRTRLNWARRKGYKYAITYTTWENYSSMVNLLKCGFRVYAPDVDYAGDVMYFRKEL